MFGRSKTRVSLNQEQLQQLCQGDIVKVGNVEIALQDIGFHEMHMTVIYAQEELLEREK